MDKKDIYEYLAKIYLDASSQKKDKSKSSSPLFKNAFFASITILAVVIIFLVASTKKNKPLNSEIALILNPAVVKINFNFDPAKKEAYSLDLNKLDLTRFKVLGFSVKKSDYKNIISLRVEFISSFKEKSEVYVKDIPHKWKDYKINLADFSGIGDWSCMSELSFVVEEWNVQKKQDVVYLDNVRLLQ